MKKFDYNNSESICSVNENIEKKSGIGNSKVDLAFYRFCSDEEDIESKKPRGSD